jgi:hypothetical protein
MGGALPGFSLGGDPAMMDDLARKALLAKLQLPAVSLTGAAPTAAAATPNPAAPPVAASAATPAAPATSLPPLSLSQPNPPPKPAPATAEAPNPTDNTLANTPPLPSVSFAGGAPIQPAKPPSAAERYQAEEGNAPDRADFQPEKRPFWKTALGTAFSVLAGARDPNQAGATARDFYAGPQQKAEKEFQQAEAAHEQKLGEISKEAQLEDTEAQQAQRTSAAAASGQKDSEALAKIGMRRDETGGIVPDENSEIYKTQQQKITLADQTQKNLQAFRQSQIDLNEARAAAEKAKADPNSPAYRQAQEKLEMARQAHAIAARNLGLHEAEFENKLNEQDLLKPSGQSQSRGDAAQSVLNLYDRPGKPGLETLVRKNAAQMGPLMGRLAKGEIAIGDVPPDVAELYGAMKSFYALQPAVHGFRNAEFVKDFETALGTLERDPESFIAGMKGLRPTLESVRDEGKTMKRRIVPPKTDGGGGKVLVEGKDF